MSWNASFSTREAFESDNPSFSTPPKEIILATPETFHQYIAGRQAAELILSRPAVLPKGAPRTDGGEPDEINRTIDYSVNLSGHANPDHLPLPLWANDTVTVSVTQR
jgi:hypothetical protein